MCVDVEVNPMRRVQQVVAWCTMHTQPDRYVIVRMFQPEIRKVFPRDWLVWVPEQVLQSHGNQLVR